jgi:hypothetical protein
MHIIVTLIDIFEKTDTYVKLKTYDALGILLCDS